MRKIASIFFAFLYFTALVQAYLPFINYSVNKDYIAKVLCVNKDKPMMHCNGKCHLKKQLNKEEKRDNSPGANAKEKYEINVYFSSLSVSPLIQLQIKSFIIDPDHYSYTAVRSVFHPPSFSI
jgi:hypothetical protein